MTDNPDIIMLCNRFAFMVDELGYDKACKFMEDVYNKRWLQSQEIIYQWYDYEFNNLAEMRGI
tara:strand:- start:443 stop:631 length:189 start_codon:yes stop_codon:yes gene_type:complete